MDKDNESYLDELLETFGQEPPYETDRRRKATARAKSGKNKNPSGDMTIESLEQEFNLDDLDDSLMDDVNLDELVSPFDKNDMDSGKEGDASRDNEADVSVEAVDKTENDSELNNTIEDEALVAEEETELSGEEDDIVQSDSEGELTDGEFESSSLFDDGDSSQEGSFEEISYDEASAGPDDGIPDTEETEPVTGGEIEADETEPFAEIGTEIDFDEDGETATEIGLEDTGETGAEIDFDSGSEEEQEPLPAVNPLDDMGAPEIISEKEAGSKRPGKKGRSSNKKGIAGLFHKLFANIPLTEEELAAIPTPEQEEAAKKEKEAEAAKKKEDKKAAAEAAKKKKAEESKKKAADNKAKKAAKDAAKKAAKKESELKRLRAEALEQPEGKINKAGAIIIFLFFMVAAAVVIVGTNIFSYDISVADATYKFGNHKYTEAYERIRGLDIKEKDMEIHDKIYTVMFVNKQLNSYNNFFAMGDYSGALDSLIKGLSRYNKYIALAAQLGIHSDLDYVRKQIMAELQHVYGVSEREALELMDMSDKQEYSERIYEIVSKLDTKAIEAQKERDELVP